MDIKLTPKEIIYTCRLCDELDGIDCIEYDAKNDSFAEDYLQQNVNKFRVVVNNWRIESYFDELKVDEMKKLIDMVEETNQVYFETQKGLCHA